MDLSDVAAFSQMAARVIEGLHGGTVTIGGTNYPASVGTPPLEDRTGAGGIYEEGTLLVVIRKEMLATMPARGTAVTISGKRWRVVRAEGGAVEAGWRLRLEPSN